MYVLASTGKIKVSDNQTSIVMHKVDGAEISKQKLVTIEVLEDNEIILIDAPVN